MNQSEFSALHGVSRKTVTAWKKRGWLVLAGDQVDVAASNANLKKYRTGAANAIIQDTQEDDHTDNDSVFSAELGALLTTSEAVNESESVSHEAERILLALGADMSMGK